MTKTNNNNENKETCLIEFINNNNENKETCLIEFSNKLCKPLARTRDKTPRL